MLRDNEGNTGAGAGAGAGAGYSSAADLSLITELARQYTALSVYQTSAIIIGALGGLFGFFETPAYGIPAISLIIFAVCGMYKPGIRQKVAATGTDAEAWAHGADRMVLLTCLLTPLAVAVITVASFFLMAADSRGMDIDGDQRPVDAAAAAASAPTSPPTPPLSARGELHPRE